MQFHFISANLRIANSKLAATVLSPSVDGAGDRDDDRVAAATTDLPDGQRLEALNQLQNLSLS